MRDIEYPRQAGKAWLARIYQPTESLIKIRYRPKSDVRARRRFSVAEIMAFRNWCNE